MFCTLTISIISSNEIVKAAPSGSKFRSIAKTLLSNTSNMLPEPSPPQGFRNKAFYHSANIALDRGLGMLETAYPAARYAAPVAKKIALPLVMIAHDKYEARSLANDEAQSPKGLTRSNSQHGSGSFRDKLKSLFDPEPEVVPTASTVRIVADDKESKKLNDIPINASRFVETTKQATVEPSTTDKIMDVLSKFRSHSFNEAERSTLKQGPAPAEVIAGVKKVSIDDDRIGHNDRIEVPRVPAIRQHEEY